ncbi:hypothetical protein A6R68_11112 [Neotoma lepida]|uniref:Uncharacterized protein n=1 Tax=Neotoma lepida TaxID=56216 RepID=A0A1A6FUY0_NEOLE|nr:hypothetical protein A6R68_11112 [Neotoma lepida]
MKTEIPVQPPSAPSINQSSDLPHSVDKGEPVVAKKMMSTNMLSESPETKKVRSPASKPPRFSILLLHVSCNTSALDKQYTKENEEEAAEYAKLLAKRMKEAKEKCQEQIAKRHSIPKDPLYSWPLPTSLSTLLLGPVSIPSGLLLLRCRPYQSEEQELELKKTMGEAIPNVKTLAYSTLFQVLILHYVFVTYCHHSGH